MLLLLPDRGGRCCSRRRVVRRRRGRHEIRLLREEFVSVKYSGGTIFPGTPGKWEKYYNNSLANTSLVMVLLLLLELCVHKASV